MVRSEAQRTLIKSPLELWEELSDPASLARHLGEFGEIRITRMDQQRTLEWEADSLSGTIELLTAGWGTRVTLTVASDGPQDAAGTPSESDPAAAAPPEHAADPPSQNGPVSAAPPEDAADPPSQNDPVSAAPPEDAADPPSQNDPVSAAPPEDAADPPSQNDRVAAAPPEDAADPPSQNDPAGGVGVAAAPRLRRGFLARLFRRRHPERAADEPRAAPADIPGEPAASPAAEPAAEPEPPAVSQPETWLEEIEAEREATQRSTAEAWRQQPNTETITDERAEAILAEVLDRLGSAHHRPFSRAT